MSNYVMFTDSASDLLPEVLEEISVKCVSLTFTFDDDEKVYRDNELAPSDFYKMMRGGAVVRTSAVNSEKFRAAFEKELSNGRDILYIGFSSGLSTTTNCARIAAEELQEKYPDRKILIVDSLAASGGEGLLVYLTAQQRDKGASIEQAAQYAEDMIQNICHWFTVDDLVYLKRGGRISSTVALVGGLLGIKPVLKVDAEGHLVSSSKVRGRKASIAALAEKYDEFAADKSGGTAFICQADCREDANELAAMLKKKNKHLNIRIMNIGSVIGAHSGPGTVAFFFVGRER